MNCLRNWAEKRNTKLLPRDFLENDGLKPELMLDGICPRFKNRGNSKNHGNSKNNGNSMSCPVL